MGVRDFAYVRRKEQKKLLRLKGQVQWEGDLEAMRANRF